MDTITSEFPNGCAMRMLADGTEQVVQHQQPQTYLQRSPPRPLEDLGLSSDQCPICLQPCPYEGNHQRSCIISCGHVYGMSCIIKWIEHKTTNAKCPQCNKKCKLKDVRKIYASPYDDQVSIQRIKELEAEVVSLRASKAALIDMVNLDGYTFNAQQIEINALKAMLPKHRRIGTLYEKKETRYKSCWMHQKQLD